MQIEYAKVSALGDRTDNQDRAAVVVAEDAVGHPVQPRVIGGGERLEGALVALLRSNHEVLVHTPHPLAGGLPGPPEGTESHPVLYRV